MSLQLGFSHAVDYELPKGISAETIKQIVISETISNKSARFAQKLREGHEPYKGKGIRYQSEYVRRKEAKKKEF